MHNNKSLIEFYACIEVSTQIEQNEREGVDAYIQYSAESLGNSFLQFCNICKIVPIDW